MKRARRDANAQCFCSEFSQTYLINVAFPGPRTAGCVTLSFRRSFDLLHRTINISNHSLPVFIRIGVSFVFQLEYENYLKVLRLEVHILFCALVLFSFLLDFVLELELSAACSLFANNCLNLTEDN